MWEKVQRLLAKTDRAKRVDYLSEFMFKHPKLSAQSIEILHSSAVSLKSTTALSLEYKITKQRVSQLTNNFHKHLTHFGDEKMKKELAELAKAYRKLGGLNVSNDKALVDAEKILAWEGNDYEDLEKRLKELSIQYKELSDKYEALTGQIEELVAENEELKTDRMQLLQSYRSVLKGSA